jgi:hypothetical protein
MDALGETGGAGQAEGFEEALAFKAAYEKRVKVQEAGRPKPNGPGLPQGSYLDSCRGCSKVEVGGEREQGEQGEQGGEKGVRVMLKCTHCRGRGPSVASELNMDTCPSPKPVDNIQGMLQVGRVIEASKSSHSV